MFRRLGREELSRIAGLLLEELGEVLREKGIRFTYDEEACQVLADLADGGRYNARDIRKVIRREVEDRVAQLLIDHYDEKIEGIALTKGAPLALTVL